MEVNFDLLGDSPASDDGGGVPSGGSTTVRSMLTKEDNKNNSEVSSSYPVGEGNLDDLELGLGLSIGGGGWSQYARILTAKDFPNSSTSGINTTATDSVSPPNGYSVVGWPPVRKAHRIPNIVNEGKNRTVGKKYRSIKVNMDGSFIGRKVDLNAHESYEMLAQTLEGMFFRRRPNTEATITKSSRLLDGTSEFVLTYEDKDGDCMLVGDVPWEMFLSSVNRLRIMRNSESNELGD